MDEVIWTEEEAGLPLRDIAFRKLREAILRGQFQPGEKLKEVSLSEQLGISRTPLREAMRMLEKEGLVVMPPRKSVRVANISPKMLQDVLEVRCALEELSAELACRNMTREGIRKLQNANHSMEEAIRRKQLMKIAQYDEEFHDTIYRIADNQKLTMVLNNLREQMFRYRLEYIKDEQVRYTILSEHCKIIDAMESGDSVAAKKIITLHIKSQETTMISNMLPIGTGVSQ